MKKEKKHNPRRKLVQFRAGRVWPRDDVPRSKIYNQKKVVDLSAMAPTLPAPGGGGAPTYRSVVYIHMLRPEQKKKSG